MPANNDEQDFSSDIPGAARNSNKLMFQLIQKRILRFDVNRTLEINTFFLNYFLVQVYFVGFEITNQFLPSGKAPSEDQQGGVEMFKKYIEILHGLFIMVPMKYQIRDPYTSFQTDKIIDRIDSYGEIALAFFYSHENAHRYDDGEMEEILKSFHIIYRFLPDLEFDPEFSKIMESKAINQLFNFTYPLNYFYERKLQRYFYPVDEELKQEFHEATNNLEKKLFSYDPNLKIYDQFLRNAVNYVMVMDFGSTELISEITDLFTNYYSLRIPKYKEEIEYTLQNFRMLFELARGRFYIKIPWNQVKKRLSELEDQNFENTFLEKFCMFRTNLMFPTHLDDFKPTQFISDYYDFLKYAGYYYMGSFHTGVMLIWRAMTQYLADLQSKREFRQIKGMLLENWCLEQLQSRGIPVEKIILRNKNLEPSQNYIEMLEQVKTFNKEPLIFEAEFIDHQQKYSFHEIDLVFRIENSLYLVECKGRSIPISKTERYMKWARNFLDVYDLLVKKTQNLGYIMQHSKGFEEHTLFSGLTNLTPIIIQTEGMISHEYHGFTTEDFLGFLEALLEGLDPYDA